MADPLRRLRELYRERDPLYRQVAHYVIETGRPSVPALVNMVLMQLELAGLVDPQRVPSPIDAGAPGDSRLTCQRSRTFAAAVHSPAMTTSASSRALVVPVDTGRQRYDILIGSGLLDAAEAWQGLPRAAHGPDRDQRHGGPALRRSGCSARWRRTTARCRCSSCPTASSSRTGRR